MENCRHNSSPNLANNKRLAVKWQSGGRGHWRSSAHDGIRHPSRSQEKENVGPCFLARARSTIGWHFSISWIIYNALSSSPPGRKLNPHHASRDLLEIDYAMGETRNAVIYSSGKWFPLVSLRLVSISRTEKHFWGENILFLKMSKYKFVTLSNAVFLLAKDSWEV